MPDGPGVAPPSVASGLGVGLDDRRGVALGVGVSLGMVGNGGNVTDGVGSGTRGVAVGIGVGATVGTGVGAGVGARRTSTMGGVPRSGPGPLQPCSG